MLATAIIAAIELPALIACASPDVPDVIEPSAPGPLPPHRTFTLDPTPKQSRRMLQPESFLRAYLQWFGGLAPHDVQQTAHGDNLFDEWKDYLAALGVPDYHIDIPRGTQSNGVMLATVGRLAEALCVRAVQHDFAPGVALDHRLVFKFEEKVDLDAAGFAPRFDLLHRTFLSYPAALAPEGRTAKFYRLYQQVSANHASHPQLTPDRTAWAAVCTALVEHPETGLY